MPRLWKPPPTRKRTPSVDDVIGYFEKVNGPAAAANFRKEIDLLTKIANAKSDDGEVKR